MAPSIALIITVLCLFITSGFTRSPTTYNVGDKYGWGLHNGGDIWARGKTFYAGDIFVFRYDKHRFNMLVVDQTGYETCIPNDGATEYSSGEDKIQLAYGGNYFIGTYNSVDCSAGMKMAINGLASELKN